MNQQEFQTLVAQAGQMTILATSGGRYSFDAEGRVTFPVRYGYGVRVTLDYASDTYTVERTFTRSGVTTVKAVRTYVFADEVGDAIYRASAYRDEFGEAA